jgi:hypothetical protein
MATENPTAADQKNTGFFAAAREVMAVVRDTINASHEWASEPLLRDGMVAAAFRQGVDEFWQALKPFPEMIQAHEPGTFMNPLPSEIAEARQTDRAVQPRQSPAEIANSNVPRGPELDNGKDLGLSL